MLTRRKKCVSIGFYLKGITMTSQEIMQIWNNIPPQGDPTGKKFALKFAQEVVKLEREKCAQVCISIATRPSNVILGTAIKCAEAIQARNLENV